MLVSFEPYLVQFKINIYFYFKISKIHLVANDTPLTLHAMTKEFSRGFGETIMSDVDRFRFI